jgi:hypothetical protein
MCVDTPTLLPGTAHYRLRRLPASSVILPQAGSRTSCSGNWKRAEKRVARSTRSGSSRKVSRGASGVRMMPALRSTMPMPV